MFMVFICFSRHVLSNLIIFLVIKLRFYLMQFHVIQCFLGGGMFHAQAGLHAGQTFLLQHVGDQPAKQGTEQCCNRGKY